MTTEATKPTPSPTHTTDDVSVVRDDQRPCEVHWKVNPVARAQFTAAEQAAATALDHRTDLVVLDVGCGRQSSLIIPGTRVLVGTDVDEKGLSRNGSIDHAVLTDIGAETLPEETLDGIVSIFALEHITTPDVVIGRLVHGGPDRAGEQSPSTNGPPRRGRPPSWADCSIGYPVTLGDP